MIALPIAIIGMAVGVNLTLMFPQGANDGVICFSGPLNMQEKYCARLTDEEALRFVVYDDATGRPIVPGTHVIGHPSIGIGRALDVHGITKTEAEYLFANDIADCEAKLRTVFSNYDQLDGARQYVLVSLAFNVGWGGFQTFRKMIAAVHRGDWNTAAAEMLDSKAARQLPARYHRMAELMRHGEVD